MGWGNHSQNATLTGARLYEAWAGVGGSELRSSQWEPEVRGWVMQGILTTLQGKGPVLGYQGGKKEPTGR